MQLPLRIRPFAMAAEEKVASALNRLADRAFLDVLSLRDKSSMVDLIADFCFIVLIKTNYMYIQTGLENLIIATDSNELNAGI